MLTEGEYSRFSNSEFEGEATFERREQQRTSKRKCHGKLGNSVWRLRSSSPIGTTSSRMLASLPLTRRAKNKFYMVTFKKGGKGKKPRHRIFTA